MSRQPNNNDQMKFIGWTEIEHCADLLINKLHNKSSFDLVVGIERGGLIPASIIAYKLNLPVYSINDQSISKNNLYLAKKNLLIVDDINDTGLTIKELKPKVEKFCEKFKIVCFYQKDHTEITNIKYGIQVPSDWWIVFPWEKEECKNSWRNK